ncbi:DNA polymerase Y family protein [Xylanimonas oleitrophica]|uniref:DNA polymerase Y family protein n=1 Tax=Xylanimonas oleitrophica TaxID=2607479 RepID=A0A2W5Y3W3_9MICO|nr:DNA polymerase Y family protein [Xylanimonas oleitrophica]PZR52564.1 DNA polymerase Y family protein [Xylanimonas oleitrophica]
MAVTGVDAHVPAAVLTHRGVVAVSAVARAHGVRRGMLRRQAQERCPELVLLGADDARDAREFEPVAVAAETVVAGIEVARPGLLLLPADGAVRYHGSERALAAALVDAVAAAGFECQVGVADGGLAAVLAARADAVVPPGGSRAFLAPRPAADLLHAVTDPGGVAAVRQVVDLWWRLGVRTLGDLAALPATSVHGRFGDLGAWAQRLARGEDVRPPARRRVEADLAVGAELDPPALRVDVATFAARRLAEELHALLTHRGLACGRLRITARTQEATLERVWRTDDTATGGMSAARITDRVRWQLEGWLTSAAARRGLDGDADVAPIEHLALAAEEVVPAGTHQPSLWGADAGQDVRAHRALGRVQGLLGGDAVLTVRVQGGRDPRDRVHLVPFGEHVEPARDATLPWPGALPAPAPATLLPEPVPVRVLDAAGGDVVIDARLAVSAPPARVVLVDEVGRQHASPPGDAAAAARVRGRSLLPADAVSPRWAGLPVPLGTASAVVGWAGPWPLAERWWAPDGGSRRVLLQVLLDDGRGMLLAATAGAWRIEALYD